MRAVNLIPSDSRRGHGLGDVRSLRGPGPALVGLLVVALVMVTLYVLASNSVSDRQAQLAGLRTQVAQTQALSAKLSAYTKFAKLTQDRMQTVKEIAASRFDWKGVLADLSRVVPANTSLQALSATVSPTVQANGSSGSASGLRGDITTPAFELQGCTATQDDVARLMSRLRVIRGVTRVTLSDSVKSSSAVTGAPVSVSSASGGAAGCGPNAPSFDLVVFFQASPALPMAPGTPATATTSTGGAP